ncbi:MAG: DUF2802 domain-containing protein, partial [Gammaproteobacteria bacterium]
ALPGEGRAAPGVRRGAGWSGARPRGLDGPLRCRRAVVSLPALPFGLDALGGLAGLPPGLPPGLLLAAGLLAAAAGLALLLSLWLLLGLRRARRRALEREREGERALEGLRGELRALCSAQAGLARHLESLEARCRQLGERLDRMDLREAGEAAYGHALRLARRGAPAEELVAQCGLSRGEAELLLRLHGGEAGGGEMGGGEAGRAPQADGAGVALEAPALEIPSLEALSSARRAAG